MHHYWLIVPVKAVATISKYIYTYTPDTLNKCKCMYVCAYGMSQKITQPTQIVMYAYGKPYMTKAYGKEYSASSCTYNYFKSVNTRSRKLHWQFKHTYQDFMYALNEICIIINRQQLFLSRG